MNSGFYVGYLQKKADTAQAIFDAVRDLTKTVSLGALLVPPAAGMIAGAVHSEMTAPTEKTVKNMQRSVVRQRIKQHLNEERRRALLARNIEKEKVPANAERELRI